MKSLSFDSDSAVGVNTTKIFYIKIQEYVVLLIETYIYIYIYIYPTVLPKGQRN